MIKSIRTLQKSQFLSRYYTKSTSEIPEGADKYLHESSAFLTNSAMTKLFSLIIDNLLLTLHLSYAPINNYHFQLKDKDNE